MNKTDDPTLDPVERITAFFNRVMLSKRNVAKLLGVSPSALLRWMDGESYPYQWTAEQALRRIDWFDEEDQASNLYTRLDAMTPRERMAELEKVIADKTNAA